MIRAGNWKLNYYSEFDSCQLFDLSTDPEERNDLAGRAECSVIVNQLKARIHERWSADDILEAQARQQRAAKVIRGSRRGARPHDVEDFVPAEDSDNQFDFSQLPAKPVDLE
tara:strand:+ start:708 stop:1043 length:336 start_codon:yes stop_codon:yes gene_type:complete